MKTKFILLSMLSICIGAFAQEGDAPFEGEIHYTNTVAVDKTIGKRRIHHEDCHQGWQGIW